MIIGNQYKNNMMTNKNKKFKIDIMKCKIKKNVCKNMLWKIK